MKTAIYPGSFDPLTNGHLDIIKRAANIFDHVIVTISINSNKIPMFSTLERSDMIKDVVSSFKNVSVEVWDGLIVDYVKKKPNAVIVKGLRALSDFEMEFQMALMNRNLKGGVETMFLMTGMDYAYVSSSMIKEIDKHRGDISPFVPECVNREMIKRRK